MFFDFGCQWRDKAQFSLVHKYRLKCELLVEKKVDMFVRIVDKWKTLTLGGP
jgi:hypothetical protein